MSDPVNPSPIPPLGPGTPSADAPPAGSRGDDTILGGASGRHSLACLFETRDQAVLAADDLVAAGFDRATIELIDQGRGSTTPDAAAETGGIWESIKRLFSGEDDTAGYYEGVRRGQTLLTLRGLDEAKAEQASAILERHDPVDMEGQEAGWRESGWSSTGAASAGIAGSGANQPAAGELPGGTAGTAAAKPTVRTDAINEPAMAGRSADLPGTPATGLPSGTTTGTTTGTTARETEQVIPVVEETAVVSKRTTGGRRVRVHTSVIETPVAEDVRLRDERVEVERRPVDRPTGTTEGAFTERTIEMAEKREEPVIEKTARVVEEVVVRKEADERTERVSDTTRRTDVKVEDDRTIDPTTRREGT